MGPTAFAAKGAVDPEQHAGAGEVMPMEQFADHLEGVAAINAAVTADMHRQFDLIGARGQRHRSRVITEKPGRLQGDQPAARHISDVGSQCADRGGGVNGADRHCRILRQGQRLVTADQVMLTETGDPVQHHTVCDGALGEQVENRVGQIPFAELLARGEIR